MATEKHLKVSKRVHEALQDLKDEYSLPTLKQAADLMMKIAEIAEDRAEEMLKAMKNRNVWLTIAIVELVIIAGLVWI